MAADAALARESACSVSSNRAANPTRPAPTMRQRAGLFSFCMRRITSSFGFEGRQILEVLINSRDRYLQTHWKRSTQARQSCYAAGRVPPAFGEPLNKPTMSPNSTAPTSAPTHDAAASIALTGVLSVHNCVYAQPPARPPIMLTILANQGSPSGGGGGGGDQRRGHGVPHHPTKAQSTYSMASLRSVQSFVGLA